MENNGTNQNQPQTPHCIVQQLSNSSAVETETQPVPQQAPKIIRKVSRISLDKLKSMGITATLKSAIAKSKGSDIIQPKVEAPSTSQVLTTQQPFDPVRKHVYATPFPAPTPTVVTYYLPTKTTVKPLPPPQLQPNSKFQILSVESFSKNMQPLAQSSSTVNRPPIPSNGFTKEFDNFRQQPPTVLCFPPAQPPKKPSVLIANLDNKQILELEHQSPKHVHNYGQIPAPGSFYSSPYTTPSRAYSRPTPSTPTAAPPPASPVVPPKTVQIKIVQPDKSRPLVQAIEKPRILNASVMPAVKTSSPIILTRVPKPNHPLRLASEEEMALRALEKLQVQTIRPYRPRPKNVPEESDFLGYDADILLRMKTQSNARARKLQKCINRLQGRYIRKPKPKVAPVAEPRPEIPAQAAPEVVMRVYERKKSVEHVKSAAPTPPEPAPQLPASQLPALQPPAPQPPAPQPPTPQPPATQPPEPMVKTEEEERPTSFPAFKPDSRYILYEIREVREIFSKPNEPPSEVETKMPAKPLADNADSPLDLSIPQRSPEPPVNTRPWKVEEKPKNQPIRILNRVDYLGLGARYTSEDETTASSNVSQKADSEDSDDEPKITIMAGSSEESPAVESDSSERRWRSRRIASRCSLSTEIPVPEAPKQVEVVTPQEVVDSPVKEPTPEPAPEPEKVEEKVVEVAKTAPTAPALRRRMMKIKPNVIAKITGVKKPPVSTNVLPSKEDNSVPAVDPPPVVTSEDKPKQIIEETKIIASVSVDPPSEESILEPTPPEVTSEDIQSTIKAPVDQPLGVSTEEVPDLGASAQPAETSEDNPIAIEEMTILPPMPAELTQNLSLPVVVSLGKPSDIMIPIPPPNTLASISPEPKIDDESAGTSFIWKKHRPIKESPVKANQVITESMIVIPGPTVAAAPIEEPVRKQLTFESTTFDQSFIETADVETMPVIFDDKPMGEEANGMVFSQPMTPPPAPTPVEQLLNVDSTPFQQLLETLKNVSGTQVATNVAESPTTSQGRSKTESELLGVIQLLLQHVNPLSLNETIIKNIDKSVKVEPSPPPPIVQTIIYPPDGATNQTAIPQEIVFTPATVPRPKFEIIKHEILQPPIQTTFETVTQTIQPLSNGNSADFRNVVPDPYEVEEDFDESHFDDPSLEVDAELSLNAPLPNFDETFDRLFGKNQPDLPAIKGISPLRPAADKAHDVVVMTEEVETKKPLAKLKRKPIPVIVQKLKNIGNTSTPKKIVKLNSRASQIVKLALQKSKEQVKEGMNKAPTCLTEAETKFSDVSIHVPEKEEPETGQTKPESIKIPPKSEPKISARKRSIENVRGDDPLGVSQTAAEPKSLDVAEKRVPEREPAKPESIETITPKPEPKISTRKRSIAYARGNNPLVVSQTAVEVKSIDIPEKEAPKREQSKPESIERIPSNQEPTISARKRSTEYDKGILEKEAPVREQSKPESIERIPLKQEPTISARKRSTEYDKGIPEKEAPEREQPKPESIEKISARKRSIEHIRSNIQKSITSVESNSRQEEVNEENPDISPTSEPTAEPVSEVIPAKCSETNKSIDYVRNKIMNSIKFSFSPTKVIARRTSERKTLESSSETQNIKKTESNYVKVPENAVKEQVVKQSEIPEMEPNMVESNDADKSGNITEELVVIGPKIPEGALEPDKPESMEKEAEAKQTKEEFSVLEDNDDLSTEGFLEPDEQMMIDTSPEESQNATLTEKSSMNDLFDQLLAGNGKSTADTDKPREPSPDRRPLKTRSSLSREQTVELGKSTTSLCGEDSNERTKVEGEKIEMNVISDPPEGPKNKSRESSPAHRSLRIRNISSKEQSVDKTSKNLPDHNLSTKTVRSLRSKTPSPREHSGESLAIETNVMSDTPEVLNEKPNTDQSRKSSPDHRSLRIRNVSAKVPFDDKKSEHLPVHTLPKTSSSREHSVESEKIEMNDVSDPAKMPQEKPDTERSGEQSPVHRSLRIHKISAKEQSDDKKSEVLPDHSLPIKAAHGPRSNTSLSLEHSGQSENIEMNDVSGQLLTMEEKSTEPDNAKVTRKQTPVKRSLRSLTISSREQFDDSKTSASLVDASPVELSDQKIPPGKARLLRSKASSFRENSVERRNIETNESDDGLKSQEPTPARRSLRSSTISSRELSVEHSKSMSSLADDNSRELPDQKLTRSLRSNASSSREHSVESDMSAKRDSKKIPLDTEAQSTKNRKSLRSSAKQLIADAVVQPVLVIPRLSADAIAVACGITQNTDAAELKTQTEPTAERRRTLPIETNDSKRNRNLRSRSRTIDQKEDTPEKQPEPEIGFKEAESRKSTRSNRKKTMDKFDETMCDKSHTEEQEKPKEVLTRKCDLRSRQKTIDQKGEVSGTVIDKALEQEFDAVSKNQLRLNSKTTIIDTKNEKSNQEDQEMLKAVSTRKCDLRSRSKTIEQKVEAPETVMDKAPEQEFDAVCRKPESSNSKITLEPSNNKSDPEEQEKPKETIIRKGGLRSRSRTTDQKQKVPLEDKDAKVSTDSELMADSQKVQTDADHHRNNIRKPRSSMLKNAKTELLEPDSKKLRENIVVQKNQLSSSKEEVQRRTNIGVIQSTKTRVTELTTMPDKINSVNKEVTKVADTVPAAINPVVIEEKNKNSEFESSKKINRSSTNPHEAIKEVATVTETLPEEKDLIVHAPSQKREPESIAKPEGSKRKSSKKLNRSLLSQSDAVSQKKESSNIHVSPVKESQAPESNSNKPTSNEDHVRTKVVEAADTIVLAAIDSVVSEESIMWDPKPITILDRSKSKSSKKSKGDNDQKKQQPESHVHQTIEAVSATDLNVHEASQSESPKPVEKPVRLKEKNLINPDSEIRVVKKQLTKPSAQDFETCIASPLTVAPSKSRNITKQLTPPGSGNASICTDSKDSGDFEGFNASSFSCQEPPEERREKMMQEIQKILISEPQSCDSDNDVNERLKPPVKRRKRQISDEDSEDDQPLNALKVTIKVPTAEKPPKVPKITLKASPKRSKSRRQTTLENHFEIVPPSAKRKRSVSPGLEKRPKLENPPESSGATYTCNRCQAKISKRDWQDHFKFHNGAAGRVGFDPDIDPTNRANLVTMVSTFIKSSRLSDGVAKCEKCSVVKKSAVGLFSHMDICGLSPEEIENRKVTCEHCLKRMASVSLTTHQRSYCTRLKEQAYKQAELERKRNEEPETPEVEEYTSTGRLKRGARKKAEKRIKKVIDTQIDETVKEFIRPVAVCMATKEMRKTWTKQLEDKNIARCSYKPKCQFESKVASDLIDHVPTCPQRPAKFYACTLCTDYQSPEEQATASHVRTAHKIGPNVEFDVSDSDASVGVESEEEEGSSGEEEVSEKSANELSDDEDRGIALHDLGRELNKKTSKAATSKSNQQAVAKVANTSMNFTVPPHVEAQRAMLNTIACNWRQNPRMHQLRHQTWTDNFRSKNYTSEVLFPDLVYNQSNFNILNETASEPYRPVITESMRFCIQYRRTYSLDNTCFEVSNWSRLKFGESSVTDDGSSMLFCGGSITAMGWVPFPPGYKGDQVLAVACKSHDQYLRLKDLQSTKCLIQFWKFENMSNKQKLRTPPVLAYSITCDDGPIQELQFCPSGGYNEAANRMGLLAATTLSGCVNIYAIPCLKDSAEPPVIALPPAFVLALSRNDADSNQAAISLTWTRAKHHMSVAAGFLSGLVAVWNLGGPSKLLNFDRNGTRCMAPAQVIPAHQAPVSVVRFHHLQNTRYLLTASLDKKVKVFDLDSGFVPFEISETLTKSRILSGDWNPNWGAFELGMDGSLLMERGGMFWKQPHDIGSDRLEILFYTESSVYDVTCNEWSDHIVSVSESGDICGVPPMQKLTNFNSKDVWARRLIYGYTDVVRLSPPKDTFPFTECYNDDNAIAFCDLTTNDYSMKAMNAKKIRPRCIVGYPFQRINKVRCNPNEEQFEFYAMGYQTGFVRVKKLPQL